MKCLRVGVIGVGNIGFAHAECIYRERIEGMTLTALCDIDPEKRAYLAEKFPSMPVFSCHTELIESGLVDCVIIATPHRSHPVIAEDALRADLHVLTEKPAGVDCQTVRRLHEIALASGKVYGIDFNQRTDPLFQRARELVKNGKIGEPKRLIWIVTNWYRSQAYYDSGDWRATWKGEGGGVLLNQAPHNLDLWQWIFGMPKRIRAFCYEGKYHVISVEDDATIYAEYENGATATFITTTGEYPGTNRLEIVGDRGKIVIEDGCLTFYRLSESERNYCFHGGDRPLPEIHVTKYEETLDLTEHETLLQNFAAHILQEKELLAPGYDGLNELTLSNAAYLSSWLDDWVELPFDEARFAELLAERASGKQQKKAVVKETLTAEGYRDRWKVRW